MMSIKGLLVLLLRFMGASAVVYALMHPWLNEWSTWTSTLWTSCWVAGILTVQALVHRFLDGPTNLVASRSWSPRDIQDRLPEGETLKLAFPVRHVAGRLPYFMLSPGFVLVVTDRRVVAFDCFKVTGHLKHQLWADDRLELSPAMSGRLELSAGNREKLQLMTPLAYRADVEYWMSRPRPDRP